MMANFLSRPLAETDPEVAEIIRREEDRQQNTLELIASENHVSVAVRAANGSVFTNKYAEGYPGKRYYGGCVNMDAIEDLARERAKQLFHAEHANVQPHSGAQANMAVYMAVLKPGDTMLSLDLAHGGHLSHGLKVNFSGAMYNVVPYGVERDTEQVSLATVRKLALEHKPKLIICGASAYPRTIDFAGFRRDRQGVRRAADGRHRAHRRHGRGRPAPLVDPARGLHDVHDAQDAARAARRADPVPRRGRRRWSTSGSSPARRAGR